MTFSFGTRSALSLAAVALIVAGHVTSASAQSLADVARKEAERRQQVTSGKVYTDGDLAAVDPATPPAPQPAIGQPPASGGESHDTPTPASAASPETPAGKESAVVQGREKRDEPYWRKTIGELRGRVAQANTAVAAQQARLAEIDAGEQTPTRLKEREVVLTTLSRAQRDVGFLNQELTRALAKAQMNKVPDDWVR